MQMPPLVPMEWLEEAGWVYDGESDSLERVSFENPFITMFMTGILLSIFPFAFWEISALNGFGNFTRLVGLFLVLAICALVLYIVVLLSTDKGDVMRIGLSDLNYTTMKRSRRTSKNSSVIILESEKEFTHKNLDVIVVKNHSNDSEGGINVSYNVRLVRKEFLGNERFFTYYSDIFGDDKGTLPAELQVPERDLIHNNRLGAGHHLQRSFSTDYRLSEQGASNLGEQLRKFFIEGGWMQLSQNSNLEQIAENPASTNGLFWESP